MKRLNLRSAVVLATAMIVLGACGGGGTPSTETKDGKANTVSQADKEKAEASDNIDNYFKLIGEDTEDSLKEAASIAAPDSVAFAYATHLGFLAETDNAAGTPTTEPQKFPKSAKGFKICDINGDGDTSDCSYYSDFETTAGKIATFSANGKPLKDRVVLGTGGPMKAGDLATVRFVSAYQSPFSNSLFVTVEIKTNSQAVETGVGEADYRRPNGRQATAANYVGDYEIGADSLMTNYIIFPGSEIGGQVSFDVNDVGYNQTSKVTFKTK